MRTLVEIREEMMSLVSMRTGDPETLHIMADDLLCEAIKYLASILPPHDPTLWPRDADDLIETFRRVPKWYA